jgi:hypothetical protein
VSTPRPSPARDIVRKVAPKLIEMTEKVVYGDVWERRVCRSAIAA